MTKLNWREVWPYVLSIPSIKKLADVGRFKGIFGSSSLIQMMRQPSEDSVWEDVGCLTGRMEYPDEINKDMEGKENAGVRIGVILDSFANPDNHRQFMMYSKDRVDSELSKYWDMSDDTNT